MASGRLISRSLGSSRKFATLGANHKPSEFAQLLFTLLVPHTDDFGRLAGDAFTMKHAVFPTSKRAEVDFEAAMDALARAGLILRYEVDGQQIAQVVDFDKHQGNLHKRTKSKFPEPPGISGNVPDFPSSRARKIESLSLSESDRIESNGEPEREPPKPPLAVVPVRRETPIVRRRNMNAAYEWRVDVLAIIHDEFVRHLGGDPAEASKRLYAWYPTVTAVWEDKPIGDNTFEFWRARFREWQGTTKKTDREIQQAQREAAERESAKRWGVV